MKRKVHNAPKPPDHKLERKKMDNINLKNHLMELNIHQSEEFHSDDGFRFRAVRVVGGWVYNFAMSSVFVSEPLEEIKVGQVTLKHFPGTDVAPCSVGVGNRNKSLWEAGDFLYNSGWPHAVVAKMLRKLNAELKVPLADKEVRIIHLALGEKNV